MRNSMPINTKMLSHAGLPEEVRRKNGEKLSSRFTDIVFDFSEAKPDCIYFTTGGSEHYAIELLDPGRMTLLAAFMEDNAYASATEVMAYAMMNGVPARLFCLDDPQDSAAFKNYLKMISDVKRIRDYKAAIIGEPSPWLVASGISNELLKQKLGLDPMSLTWEELGDYRHLDPDKGFFDKYGINRSPGLEDASRVNNLLWKAIKKHGLNAITVECFPLVKQQHVTACLSLSDINDRGIVAACEGDLTSMTGMILSQVVTGMIPWMANIARITENRLLLAHCTAPTNLLSGFTIDTHFETGVGTAVRGKMDGDDVTIFRLDNLIENAFLAKGKIMDRPDHPFACRTQVEIELNDTDIKSLKNNPLGNHHLLLPGDFLKPLEVLLSVLHLKKVNHVAGIVS